MDTDVAAVAGVVNGVVVRDADADVSHTEWSALKGGAMAPFSRRCRHANIEEPTVTLSCSAPLPLQLLRLFFLFPALEIRTCGGGSLLHRCSFYLFLNSPESEPQENA